MISTPAILLMTTKKMIQNMATIPLMKKVNLTMFASSTLGLDGVLGMASVEFGGSAGSEDCLVVHLAVASS